VSALVVVCQAIVRPRSTGARDVTAASTLAGSRAGRVLQTVLHSVVTAWSDSQARQQVARLAVSAGASGTADRVRTVALTGITASIVALALRLLSSPVQPLTWLVPVGAAGVGLLALAGARPIAAACGDLVHDSNREDGTA
jgi:hypothetical protein